MRDVYSLINLPELVREIPTLLQWPYYYDGEWCAVPAQGSYPEDQRIEPSSMPQVPPRLLNPRPFPEDQRIESSSMPQVPLRPLNSRPFLHRLGLSNPKTLPTHLSSPIMVPAENGGKAELKEEIDVQVDEVLLPVIIVTPIKATKQEKEG